MKHLCFGLENLENNLIENLSKLGESNLGGILRVPHFYKKNKIPVPNNILICMNKYFVVKETITYK